MPHTRCEELQVSCYYSSKGNCNWSKFLLLFHSPLFRSLSFLCIVLALLLLQSLTCLSTESRKTSLSMNKQSSYSWAPEKPKHDMKWHGVNLLLWVTLSGRIQTEGFLLPVRNKFVCFTSCPLPFQEQRGIEIKYLIITPCSFGGVRSLCEFLIRQYLMMVLWVY